jgi:hypothetical protein
VTVRSQIRKIVTSNTGESKSAIELLISIPNMLNVSLGAKLHADAIILTE